MVGVPSAAVSGQWFVATRRGRAHRDRWRVVCLRSGEVEASHQDASRTRAEPLRGIWTTTTPMLQSELPDWAEADMLRQRFGDGLN